MVEVSKMGLTKMCAFVAFWMLLTAFYYIPTVGAIDQGLIRASNDESLPLVALWFGMLYLKYLLFAPVRWLECWIGDLPAEHVLRFLLVAVWVGLICVATRRLLVFAMSLRRSASVVKGD